MLTASVLVQLVRAGARLIGGEAGALGTLGFCGARRGPGSWGLLLLGDATGAVQGSSGASSTYAACTPPAR